MTDRPVREGALEPKEDERVREAVRELVKELGSQSAAAKKIGFSQQSISRHLEGFPAGKRLAAAVASASGTTLEKLLGRVVVYDQTALPRWNNLPGWREAVARAADAFPDVTAEEWEAIGRRHAEDFVPGAQLTSRLLLSQVEALRQIRAAVGALRTREDVAKAIAEEGDAVAPPKRRGK